jgi:hypothetical protein
MVTLTGETTHSAAHGYFFREDLISVAFRLAVFVAVRFTRSGSFFLPVSRSLPRAMRDCSM